MEHTLEFRRLNREEAPQMFQLIRQRMAWMDEKGLRQWNVTGYEEAYPLAYYEQAQQDGQTFGLFDSGTAELLCAAALL